MQTQASQYDAVMNAPLGKLGICIENDKLVKLEYLGSDVKPKAASDPLSKEVFSQLNKYFSDPGFVFDLPLKSYGTDHQQRVWRALRKISTGKTASYGQIADKLGSGARAVGNACRHNPISIIVPCHRVIAAHGVGGYGGATNGVILKRKLWLLEHEGAL